MTKESKDSVMRVRVWKFDGTSMARMKEVVGIVKKSAKKNPKTVIVCSALSGVTECLYRIIDDAVPKTKKLAILSGLIELHLGLVDNYIESPQNRSTCTGRIKKINTFCRKNIILKGDLSEISKAYILSIGERLSCLLFETMLREQGLRAICLNAEYVIKTKDVIIGGETEERKYIDVEVDMAATKQAILQREEYETEELDSKIRAVVTTNCAEKKSLAQLMLGNQIVIIPGFTGSNSEGSTTILGRGSSDLSACVVGSALNSTWNISDTYRFEVPIIDIFTDVDGLLSADPRVVKRPKLVRIMTDREALKLAVFGSKALYLKAIILAMSAGIPVRIRNTFKPRCVGTTIVRYNEGKNIQEKKTKRASRQSLIAITYKYCSILSFDSVKNAEEAGFIEIIGKILKKYDISVNLISSDGTGLSLTIEDTVSDHTISQLIIDLEAEATVFRIKECTIIFLTGEGIAKTPHRILGKAFRILDKEKITAQMLSLRPTPISVGFVIERSNTEQAIKLLHKEFFERQKARVIHN